MTDSHDRLEILISRCLDGEASLQDRRELNSRLRRDSAADALFEETRALDREIGLALRRAMARQATRPRTLSLASRAGRYGAIGVAAALAFMAWMRPSAPAPGSAGNHHAPQMASWFAPPPTWADTLSDAPSFYERPQVRIGDADRDWIVVPGDGENEFLVVEVKRVHTRAIRLHEDF